MRTEQALQNKEEMFFNLLNDLTLLNDIGLSHSKDFERNCEKKKRKIKSKLNDLIIEFKSEGTKHPEILKFM